RVLRHGRPSGAHGTMHIPRDCKYLVVRVLGHGRIGWRSQRPRTGNRDDGIRTPSHGGEPI
ncbi:hypothetical protein ACFOYZ_30030, partial [Neobacillus cucumis]|uniref:hypothetical protein n=1 Tax=Neobacillus cucumis TaxID=1740721 RepID=UPI00361D0A82